MFGRTSRADSRKVSKATLARQVGDLKRTTIGLQRSNLSLHQEISIAVQKNDRLVSRKQNDAVKLNTVCHQLRAQRTSTCQAEKKWSAITKQRDDLQTKYYAGKTDQESAIKEACVETKMDMQVSIYLIFFHLSTIISHLLFCCHC